MGRKVRGSGPGAVGSGRIGAASAADDGGRQPAEGRGAAADVAGAAAVDAGPSATAGEGADAGGPGLELGEAVAELLEGLGGSASDATVTRVEMVLNRFVGWCASHEVTQVRGVDPALVSGFVTSPLPQGGAASPATMDGRRAAVRVLFRHLRASGTHVGDPTVDLRVPGRVRRGARPLTDEEVLLGRQTAQLRTVNGGGYATAAWALAEAGALSAEIPMVRIDDLDDPSRPGIVALPGTRRHDPRGAELTDWGSAVLARQVRALREGGCDDGAALAYRGRALRGGAASQSAVCTALRSVLLQAGLGDGDNVRPASIRHWAGRRRYEAGMPIEQVARWLGMRSLDAVAYDLAITWRREQAEPPGEPEQPPEPPQPEHDSRRAPAPGPTVAGGGSGVPDGQPHTVVAFRPRRQRRQDGGC